MEQYVVKGGVPLRGKVSIGGAKNAALGILAAAIMTDDTVTIENVPNVRDTRVLLLSLIHILLNDRIKCTVVFLCTPFLFIFFNSFIFRNKILLWCCCR